MMKQIEIFEDAAGQYRFRVKGRNGEIVAQSEGYTRKDSAEHGIRALLDAAARTQIVAKAVLSAFIENELQRCVLLRLEADDGDQETKNMVDTISGYLVARGEVLRAEGVNFKEPT